MVVAIGKPKNGNAFGNFTECYEHTVSRKGPGYQRIDALRQSNDKKSTLRDELISDELISQAPADSAIVVYLVDVHTKWIFSAQILA